LIEFDGPLFEQLISEKHETRVKDEQVWLIFFDSPVCRRCDEVMDTWEDLANIAAQIPTTTYKIGHLMCPKALYIC